MAGVLSGPVHEHRLRVRYGETDQMGVVHHACYLAYLEEGRTRMMADLGCSYAELERSGLGLPVRRAALRFLAPAFYEEELLVRTHVERVRSASVVFASDVVRAADGTLVARGEIELACIDLHDRDKGPQPLPDRLRSVLSVRTG
jgi:acyl-CoA thioester hydrolase